MVKHQMVSENKSACGRLVTQGTGADCKNCARVSKAREAKSGVDILANLLSLDGGKTPAKITTVEADEATRARVAGRMLRMAQDINARFSINDRVSVEIDGIRNEVYTFVDASMVSVYLYAADGAQQTVNVEAFHTAMQAGRVKLADQCEGCHAAPATKTLKIHGAFVGSSSPSSQAGTDDARLCDADYRAALATCNEDGAGVVYVYWHAHTLGERNQIRYDREHCTRYVFIGTNQMIMGEDARHQARRVQPGYAPTITGNGFNNPNAKRAYRLTRKGVAETVWMTRSRAKGTAWEYRYMGGRGFGPVDDTFGCVEIDPVTGETVEIIW